MLLSLRISAIVIYSFALIIYSSIASSICTSSLRKSILPARSDAQVPLISAEVDILMQRRNTKIGNIYATHDELYNDRLAKNAIEGRSEVEAAIKNIQRFTLQLDRSDGRPDIELPVVAKKFDDFISTCLRTEGAAWTASIGPLEYLGLKLDSIREKKDDCSIIFRTSDLCSTMVSCLLGVENSDRLISVQSEDNKLAIWNLGILVTRVFLRYLIMERELNGVEVSNDTEVDRMPLYIQYSHESCPIIPPAYIIESILSLDMCVNYSLDTELNCFIISGDEISQWKSRNTLS
mmetsp:Transcript_26822/g.25681  ORF Transcript_26822/g.25681 Transcript_26822/m.25681 type:complete len:292 (+) Transcript_26822:72-947(+)